MPLNVMQVSQVKDELIQFVRESRVDKIEQPGRHVIVITFKSKQAGINRLYISVSSNDTRVHLTDYKFENPVSPPMFCMLLRKHLLGAKVTDITQPQNDRILEITFKASTALGDKAEKRLIIELFGRVPNVILIDGEGIIIDCLRRISGDSTGRRMLLPGLRYLAPVKSAEFQSKSDEIYPPESNVSISKMLDEQHSRRAKDDSMRQRSSELLKKISTAQKRLKRKLTLQKEELKETSKRDYNKECGELITANIYKMKKGDEILLADDYYNQTEKKRKIKLDPLKTPQQNAAKYFKAYTKARNAEKYLTEQIILGENELQYIESVIEQIERVSNGQELEDIRNEIIQTGYLKKKDNKKVKSTEPKPHIFSSTTGFLILAGKNNIQNEKLTFKTASRTDIWLHAQKIHGCHVIIRLDGRIPDDETLTQAANIAAYYSAARSAGKVQVDYTQVKYVKKQAESHPGMVIYTDYKTITVKPDEEMILKLKE